VYQSVDGSLHGATNITEPVVTCATTTEQMFINQNRQLVYSGDVIHLPKLSQWLSTTATPYVVPVSLKNYFYVYFIGILEYNY
jgi:hypothetical protein